MSRRLHEPGDHPPRVLHVVHGWPPESFGGTESYARWLAVRQARSRRTVVLARSRDPESATGDLRVLEDEGCSVHLLTNHFDQRNPLARSSLHWRVAHRALATACVDVDLIHVHHLAGLSLGLALATAVRSLPVVLQLQDWWLLCARANLLDHEQRLCPGPLPTRCSRCLPLTRRPGRRIWNPALYRLRGALARRLVRRSRRILAGSHAIVGSVTELGLLRDVATPVEVIPYGVALADEIRPGEPRAGCGTPIRLGFIGSLLPHKGLDAFLSAMSASEELCSAFSIEAWGDPSVDSRFTERLRQVAGSVPLTFHGNFEESAKPSVFRAIDVLVVPSRGLESFGLVVREAAHQGVPSLVGDRGALGQLDDLGAGCLSFDPDDPAAVRAALRELARPGAIDRLRRALVPVKGMDEHALEVERFYERALRTIPHR
jgi:glycosyltransferase involved in cell wall biosynthesis